MIGEPFAVGACQDKVADALPRTTVKPMGAEGGPAGVTMLDGAESGPAPTELIAATVNVYDEPLLNPETTHGLAAHMVTVPPGKVLTR